VRIRRRARAETRLADDADPAAVGEVGEQLGMAHLAARGYRCVGRNVRTRHGEIDLLLRRRRLFVAVEVKTRRREPTPEAAVDDARIARLQLALSHLARWLRPPPRSLRVDVLAVGLPRGQAADIWHFPGAEFPPPDAGAR